MSTKLHAKFSASGSSRWMVCAGSIKLSEKAPPETESKWAKEGTDAHTVLEYLLRNRHKRLAAAAFLRSKYPLQMVVHAETTLNYIEDRLAKLPGAELLIEERTNLPVSEPGQFGTADIVIVDYFGKLIVMDYKYGAGIPVHPENNSQMIYYALGVAHKLHYNFSDVELVIVQPRAWIGGKTIRTWETTIETLIAWRELFEAGIRAAKRRNAPLISGDHCRFCPAKPICPETKNSKLRKAQSAFDDGEYWTG